MFVENEELLPELVKYIQSDNMSVMNEACWVISNLINGGSDEVKRKLIHTDHCIEWYIDVMKKTDDKDIGNIMIVALRKCIALESELKEVCVNLNLKEILEQNDTIDKLSRNYRLLLSSFVDGYEVSEEEDSEVDMEEEDEYEVGEEDDEDDMEEE